ncbi:PDZ domain-containing protein [Alteromonas sediminis]|uniref:PDZ domain-containing protein n=1 Tax=Alteromonas sediminis TaxID=2259342 RepID=A0A3N5YQ46_9ALTE|nr:alpha/beta fold hydrolase [Alteromonas sediminis]RPJ68121.1 PDZ domain-containing protein [Alteromonas sediminis]
MKITFVILGVCLYFCFTIELMADDSERRARWHASFQSAQPLGREITEITPESPLGVSGLKVGDIIIGINNEVVRDGNHWWDLTNSLRAETKYLITYKRNNKVDSTTVVFKPEPKESYEDLNVEYGFITSDFGIKQRLITTLPNDVASNLSAIFVVGGLSCSSMEYLPGRTSKFIRGLRDLAQQSGMLMMRIEKPGVGDSEGRCSDTDFVTELNGYEVALQLLLTDKRIDPEKVIIYGNSMGAALAPYLANKYGLNGVISDGPFYRSWFEHMLEIERRIQAMNGHDQTEVNRRLIEAYIPLYYGMLIEKKSYQDMIDENPLLGNYNYHSSHHMYGRPMAFYHQMQDFNFAGEWSKLTMPTRVRWGSNDWIMSEYDIDMIEQALTENGNKDIEILKVSGLDHWFAIHESALDSYQGKPGEWDDATSKTLVTWAKEINK